MRQLPFTSPWLLAPMEGITDPAFRDLVLARHRPDQLGGAFTEFVMVVDSALPRRRLRAHLGERRFAIPVGLQLMGNNLDALAETARRAVAEGAPLIDLNFGCPAKGAMRTCAGSALLADPTALESIVRTCVRAVPEVPVTAKVRSGVDHDRDVEVIARAAENGGAALLTIHCRTRTEGYRQEALDWNRVSRAVGAVSIPVCGNGGVDTHAGLERMRRETGCAYVMAGRGAVADPWLFSGDAADLGGALDFLLEYGEIIHAASDGNPRAILARLKQLIRFWTAADLFAEDRAAWLVEMDAFHLVDRLRRRREEIRRAEAPTRAPRAPASAAAPGRD